MAVREFPALGFDPAPGDAAALDSAARAVGGAGTVLGDAAANVTRLNSSGWTGDAADSFRGQLADLPRDLDLAARSHTTAARALADYGTGLATRQRRAAELETRAAELRRQEAAAVAEVNRLAARTAPAGSPELTALRAGYDAARSRATSVGSDLQEVLAQARRLHQEHRSAAGDAARTIRNQADAPYEEPGWLSRGWTAVKGWIADHADVLTTISTALKGVSAVLGVLSFVPGLQFLAPFAIAAGGIALALDVAVKLATGKGSWAAIGLDTALTVVPGGRILSGLKGARGAVAGERGLAAGERVPLRSATADPRAAAVPLEKKVCAADPVDVVTGRMVLRQVDVELPGVLPLVLARTHGSAYRVGRCFGPSWASTLDLRVEADGAEVRFADDDGSVLVYPAPVDGPVLPAEGPRLPLAATADGWTVTRPGGHVLHFGADGLLTALTDRAGASVRVLRDAAGTPVELRHSGGYRVAVESERGLVTALRLRDGGRWVDLVRYGYAAGHLAAVVDSSGAPLRFRYDADGRIVRWDDRNGTWYEYEFDAAGRVVRTVGADGALSATFAYGDQVTVVTDSLGARTAYEHDAARQVVRVVDPLGHATTSEWDRYDRLLARTDPLGRTTRWAYDPSGAVLRVERPDGTVSSTELGPLGLPVRVVDPDGAVWRYAYDERGLVTAVTDPAGATTRYRYDERGHLVAVIDALRRTRTVLPDAAGLPVAVTDPLGATTRCRRDAHGRVVEVTDPLGAITRYAWTPEGRLAARTLPDGVTDRWAYDGEGNEVEHVDPLGQVTRTEISGFDLVTARTAPDGARTRFEHDTELRLTAVTDPTGLRWTYEYDPAGRLVRETDYDGRTLTYTYSPAGHLVERTTNGTRTVRWAHDAAGRVVRQEVDGDVTTFRHDAAGRLVGAAGGGTVLELVRDRMGRVVAEVCDGRTVTSRYDLLGRRTWRRTPSGAETGWEYGPGDLPVALRAGRHTVVAERDAAGRETRRRHVDGTVLDTVWDATSRPVSETLHAPDSPDRGVRRRSFGHRADGLLVAVEDPDTGPRHYDLDASGRITAATGADGTERYEYGPAGALVASAAGEDRWTYEGTRLRRAGRIRYEHDDAGRVVLRQQRMPSSGPRTWRYRWDGLDRLVEVETPDGSTWRYRYDPLGRRVAKVRVGTDGAVAEQTLFSWDGTALAEQVDTGGTSTTWDRDAATGRVVDQRERDGDGTDERFYGIVTDVVGTPTELYDPDGTIVWRGRSTVWGVTTTNGSTSCPLRFPGQYADAETGLHHNYFRYYDPATARYASPDPVGLRGGPDPAAYVRNPLFWVDPFGLTPCEYFRGARPGEEPTFVPRPNEFRVDPATGTVRSTHGLSVFDNAASVTSRGFVPHGINPATVPEELMFLQRGRDPRHFEIVPRPGTALSPEQYAALLGRIRTR